MGEKRCDQDHRLGNEFFLVEFSHPKDHSKALIDGPWLIYDHYLTVKEWCPSFHPSSVTP